MVARVLFDYNNLLIRNVSKSEQNMAILTTGHFLPSYTLMASPVFFILTLKKRILIKKKSTR